MGAHALPELSHCPCSSQVHLDPGMLYCNAVGRLGHLLVVAADSTGVDVVSGRINVAAVLGDTGGAACI
jgi:hypothetical protein